jgi:hypothetical protein
MKGLLHQAPNIFGSAATGFGQVATIIGGKVIGNVAVKDTHGAKAIGRTLPAVGNGYPVIGDNVQRVI